VDWSEGGARVRGAGITLVVGRGEGGEVGS